MSQLDEYMLQHDRRSPIWAKDEPEVVKCGWCGTTKVEGRCPKCDPKEGDPCFDCDEDCNHCKKF